MKKYFNVLIISLLVIVMLGLVLPLVSSIHFFDTFAHIEVAEEELCLYPGQQYTLNPIIIYSDGTIETNQKFTFESSDPNLISFYSEDSGTFEVVSKETTDKVVTLTCKSGLVSKKISARINKEMHVLLDVDLNNNDNKELLMGESYLIDFETFPNDLDVEDLDIEVVSIDKTTENGLIEYSKNKNIIIKPVGTGSGYIHVSLHEQ